jgi:hypothetical protein
MALDSYLNKRTIKAEMLNQLKTKGMDDQRLERMAQKSALSWIDVKDCVTTWQELPQS